MSKPIQNKTKFLILGVFNLAFIQKRRMRYSEQHNERKDDVKATVG